MVLRGESLLLTRVDRLWDWGLGGALQNGGGCEGLRVTMRHNLHLVLGAGRVAFHDLFNKFSSIKSINALF